MEILLEKLNELEKNIQKLSVIDKEKYDYFQQKVQEIRNKLVEVDVTKTATLQQEIDKIIDNINKLKNEFSNYMRTGNLEKTPEKLFFELPEEDDSIISGNEKVKRHRLELLASTVELVKKDVELNFSKVEQTIEKFNNEKNNKDQEYSQAEIAYIDRLISELFIEYQKKYYQKNSTLPPEEPATYCNMDTYEAIIRVLASEKLLEEKDRIKKIEGLILDGEVVNNSEIWNMIAGVKTSNKMAIKPLNTSIQHNENPEKQLIPVKRKNRINNDLVLTLRKKNIFGNLVEKTKRIKLDVSGAINIPNEMRLNIVKAVLPEGIQKISQMAFCNCINLSEVFIPESVIEIEPNAFQRCRSLKDIKLPDNLTRLGFECFRESGLHKVKIPGSVIRIDTMAFDSCVDLRQVLLEEGLKQIANNAFSNTSIEEIKIPDSVEKVGNNFLEYSYLNTISLPKNLEDVKLKSICGENIPKCIIRGKDIDPGVNKKGMKKENTTVDREIN